MRGPAERTPESAADGVTGRRRKILFLTGTRADFGKLKPLMRAVQRDPRFDLHVFVTGMHLFPKFGSTGDEVAKSGFSNVFPFINQSFHDTMAAVLANTIHGLGNYLAILQPDMLVVHGDRVEPLAGAVAGALNNILVSHIEGGEVSGAIDESIRHAVSKLSHLHFVANDTAKRRLLQMGEPEANIFVIGSPDVDLMLSPRLPSLSAVRRYYEVPFNKYAILIYHPVTTSLHQSMRHIEAVTQAALASKKNFVVVYPNNDSGSDIIIEEYAVLRGLPRFRVFPSLRFEYFLVLLRNAEFILGNSSAGIREAPIYAVPTINIGDRQHRRFDHDTILNIGPSRREILAAIRRVPRVPRRPSTHFGTGNSAGQFLRILRDPATWKVTAQKFFVDRAEAAVMDSRVPRERSCLLERDIDTGPTPLDRTVPRSRRA